VRRGRGGRVGWTPRRVAAAGNQRKRRPRLRGSNVVFADEAAQQQAPSQLREMSLDLNKNVSKIEFYHTTDVD
jgi:hypothetical protein